MALLHMGMLFLVVFNFLTSLGLAQDCCGWGPWNMYISEAMTEGDVSPGDGAMVIQGDIKEKSLAF